MCRTRGLIREAGTSRRPFGVPVGDRGRHSVAVSALHPAVAAPLSDVVTRRLAVRCLGFDDVDELATMFAHPAVWEFEYERGMTQSETQAFLDRQLRLWAECGFGGCAVRELEHRCLVGVVGLAVPAFPHELVPAVTVGWRFSPTVWGRGYATEAAAALLDQAFTTMNLDRVGCVTNAENRRSVAVAERLSMSLIGETRVPRDDQAGTVTALIFHVTRRDWLTTRNDQGEHS
jgi:RimJ/RimL family protein N-acetyltransferase